MERNYLVDNCKALLIVLVVFGHLIALGPSDHSEICFLVWMAIYAFHMPAFMFFSGVFAKATGESAAKSAVGLFASYALFTLLVSLANVAVGAKFNFNLVSPVFSAWFLLSLMTMRLLLPAVAHIRGALVILVLISLLVPLVDQVGTVFSLARTAYFFPFFYAGYMTGAEGIAKVRNRVTGWKKLGVVVLALLSLMAISLLAHFNVISDDALWAKTSYAKSGFPNWQIGVVMRCCMMLVATSCIVALLVVLPSRKMPFTYVGTNSLSAYVLQAPAIVLLPSVSGGNMLAWGAIFLISSILFCAIAAAGPVNKVIGYPAQLARRYLLASPKPKSNTPS